MLESSQFICSTRSARSVRVVAQNLSLSFFLSLLSRILPFSTALVYPDSVLRYFKQALQLKATKKKKIGNAPNDTIFFQVLTFILFLLAFGHSSVPQVSFFFSPRFYSSSLWKVCFCRSPSSHFQNQKPIIVILAQNCHNFSF